MTEREETDNEMRQLVTEFSKSPYDADAPYQAMFAQIAVFANLGITT